MSQNPFVVGKPVSDERFIGRELELNTAFDQIHNRSHLALWGSPGIGKTSFLKHLVSPQSWQLRNPNYSQAVIIQFSCLSINPFDANKFWRKILTLLKDKLIDEPDLPSFINNLLGAEQPLVDSLRQVLKKLGEQDKFLLLLIDDYDASLLSNENYQQVDINNFVYNCRNLAYHCEEAKHLSMIVTSCQRLNDINPLIPNKLSPWFNHYLFSNLTSFNEIDVEILLHRIPLTTNLKRGIRQIAAGHPALLQIAGFYLYQELRIGQVPNVETFVTNFESATRHIFQDMWEKCNKEEQVLLMLIALSNLRGRLPHQSYNLKGIENIFSYKQPELKELEERGIIIINQKEGKTVYSFSSLIMERWIIQEIGNSNQNELEKRQKVFLSLMSKKQSETLITSIKWLWNNKDKIPSILKLIEKLFG